MINAFLDFVEDKKNPQNTARMHLEDIELRRKDLVVSDIVDLEGNQYVDLVQQGGGMLGIALVGYVYALEKAGIRFLNLAGTSAGAINALLIAALGPPKKSKGNDLLKKVSEMNPKDFIDGFWPSRVVSKYLMRSGFLPKAIGYPMAPLAFVRLWWNLGLHPGKKFHKWLTKILEENNCSTIKQLEDRMKHEPFYLEVRKGRKEKFKEVSENEWVERLSTATGAKNQPIPGVYQGKIAMVAVEGMTKSKFVFPEMGDLIFKNPKEKSPADYVRASMSVPWFFDPFRVKREASEDDKVPNGTGHLTIKEKWKLRTGISSPIPENLFFIDGGLVSNFPISLFHNTSVIPLAPTFGIRLGPKRIPSEKKGLLDFSEATLDSARQALDFDFLYNNPDYRHLIGDINTDGFDWLDFSMDPKIQKSLFFRGVIAAKNFLFGNEEGNTKSKNKKTKGFDWNNYKEIRRRLMQAQMVGNDLRTLNSSK